MRITSMPESELARALLPVDTRIREAYLKQMSALVAETPIKVMLGDTTVTDQTTFDAGGIKTYMQKITARLGPSWHAREVTETRDDDVRRIFVKLESEAAGYALSVHLSVQYKALLYYKPDARVEQIQRELGRIDESAKSDRESIADAGDRIAAERLKGAGCVEPDSAELFETLYRDESLAESIEDEIRKTVDDAGLAVHADRRDSLFAETRLAPDRGVQHHCHNDRRRAAGYRGGRLSLHRRRREDQDGNSARLGSGSEDST